MLLGDGKDHEQPGEHLCGDVIDYVRSSWMPLVNADVAPSGAGAGPAVRTEAAGAAAQPAPVGCHHAVTGAGGAGGSTWQRLWTQHPEAFAVGRSTANLVHARLNWLSSSNIGDLSC